MADALDVGIGTRSVLLTRAVAEMSRLGAALGADARTFSGLAGLGNLLVRSSVEDGRQSPSYRLGLELVAGTNRKADGEGARAARAGLRMAHRCGQRMPVLEVICAVLDGEASPGEAAERIALHVAEEE
jgi:glycerol-3-phosphate dehydrogenase (NAD(P)+)